MGAALKTFQKHRWEKMNSHPTVLQMQLGFCISSFHLHRLKQQAITPKSDEGMKNGHADTHTEKVGSGGVCTLMKCHLLPTTAGEDCMYIMYKTWWELYSSVGGLCNPAVPGCKHPGKGGESCSWSLPYTLVNCSHLHPQENFTILLSLTHVEHSFANFPGA